MEEKDERDLLQWNENLDLFVLISDQIIQIQVVGFLIDHLEVQIEDE